MPADYSMYYDMTCKPATSVLMSDSPYDVIPDLEGMLQDMIAFLIDDNATILMSTMRTASKVIFSVTVPPKEMGKIIGKKGILIKSLTMLMKAIGNKYGHNIEIELVDHKIIAGAL